MRKWRKMRRERGKVLKKGVGGMFEEIKPLGVLNRCSTSARFLWCGERRGRGGK